MCPVVLDQGSEAHWGVHQTAREAAINKIKIKKKERKGEKHTIAWFHIQDLD